MDANPEWNTDTNYATPSGRLRISVANAAVTTSFQEANATAWRDLHVQQAFDPQAPLLVSFFFEVTSALATVTFRDFLKTGDQYPFESASNAALFTSEVFDAGRPAARWDRISWWEDRPTMTCDVEFQVAARNENPEGDWESDFRGPDATASSWYTTAAGEDLNPGGEPAENVVGRYFRYHARLISDGTSTPAFTDLRVTMVGDNPWYDRRYTFDARGNMVGKTVLDATGQVDETRTVNELNQIEANAIDDGTSVTTWTYTWDPNGNLESKSRPGEAWTYDFDKDNRLVRVVHTVGSSTELDISYTYDSIGRVLTRKLSTDTNPTRFEWDGWDLVREVAPDGTKTVYYAPQGEILSFKRGSSVYQVHADALDSVKVVTDSTGSALVASTTDAWGTQISDSDSIPGGFSRRWLGAKTTVFDSATGLYRMPHRWYDSGIGRFISREPLLFETGNLYSYALNNPTTYKDASGLEPCRQPNFAERQKIKAFALTRTDEHRKKMGREPVPRDWSGVTGWACADVYVEGVQGTVNPNVRDLIPGTQFNKAGNAWLPTMVQVMKKHGFYWSWKNKNNHKFLRPGMIVTMTETKRDPKTGQWKELQHEHSAVITDVVQDGVRYRVEATGLFGNPIEFKTIPDIEARMRQVSGQTPRGESKGSVICRFALEPEMCTLWTRRRG